MENPDAEPSADGCLPLLRLFEVVAVAVSVVAVFVMAVFVVANSHSNMPAA